MVIGSVFELVVFEWDGVWLSAAFDESGMIGLFRWVDQVDDKVMLFDDGITFCDVIAFHEADGHNEIYFGSFVVVV